jgi:hypothetical protein
LSREYKSLLRLKDPIPPSTECPDLGKVFLSNHPSVLITFPKDSKLLQEQVYSVSGTDVDLELEISTSEAFLEYRFIELVTKYLSGILEALCRLGVSQMPNLMSSPFHKDRFLHVSGEAISELKCNPATVTASLGDRMTDWCTRDLLPVMLKDKPVFIQANTRLIIESVAPVHTNCTILERPVFETLSGSYVTADPTIRMANLHMDEERGLNLHAWFGTNLTGLYEDEWGQSLLYDHDAMQELSSAIHFGMTRTKVLSSLTKAYCSQGECGSYSPSEAGGFDANRLLASAKLKLNIWHNAYEVLLNMGSFCSLGVAIYVIVWCIVFCARKYMPGCQWTAPVWLQNWTNRSTAVTIDPEAERPILSEERLITQQKLIDLHSAGTVPPAGQIQPGVISHTSARELNYQFPERSGPRELTSPMQPTAPREGIPLRFRNV